MNMPERTLLHHSMPATGAAAGSSIPQLRQIVSLAREAAMVGFEHHLAEYKAAGGEHERQQRRQHMLAAAKAVSIARQAEASLARAEEGLVDAVIAAVDSRDASKPFGESAQALQSLGVHLQDYARAMPAQSFKEILMERLNRLSAAMEHAEDAILQRIEVVMNSMTALVERISGMAVELATMAKTAAAERGPVIVDRLTLALFGRGSPEPAGERQEPTFGDRPSS